MTTTLETAPTVATPAFAPVPSTPKVLFYLTPALKKNLCAFLARGSRKDNPLLRVTHTATHSHLTLLTSELISITFTLPHTQGIPAESHLRYSGTFYLASAQSLLTLLRQAEPDTVVTLGLTPGHTTAYFAFRLHGQPTRMALDTVIKGQDLERYPHHAPTPESLKNLTYHLDADWFKPILQRDLAFASTDETRLVLNGLYFEPSNNGRTLTLTSTNGRILITHTFTPHPISLPAQPLADHIQPSALLHHTLALLTPTKAHSLHIGFPDGDDTPLHHLQLPDLTSITLVAPLSILASYPNYRAVIPKRDNAWRTLHLFDPAAAAALAAQLGTVPGSNNIHLSINGSHAHLIGAGSARYPIATVSGGTTPIDPSDPVITAFNPDFLAAVLAASTKLHWLDAISPLIGTANATTTVIMPMRAAA
jgi:hypothetical protein